MTPLIAHFAPARGFPLNQVIPATAVFVAIVVAVTWESIRYRKGRAPRLQAAVDRLQERTGLPGWLPAGVAVTTASLFIAAFGFYWDVSVHIDKGRDSGPFGTPAHYPIVVGLLGIALAGVIATVIGADRRSPTSVRLTRNWSAPVGGLLVAICGMIALAGFPLDDVWHTLFGQDVTLWSPTHIQMIGGASLATLAMWVLLEEGRRSASRPRAADGWLMRNADVLIGGAFLIGLSTLQAEFDYGVPQFRQLYHPVLIMVAAGIGLVAVRVRGGRWAAVKAAGVFLAARVLLAVLIGPVLGRSILHFPLYLPEALMVEAAAFVVPRTRQLTRGLVAGIGIGTVGLAAEWGWSQVWAPLAWHASLLPDAAIFGLVGAVGGALIGAIIGRSLLPPEAVRQRTPRLVGATAWAAALVALVFPFHMTADTGYRATVALTRVPGGTTEDVTAVVALDPPNAATGANWFDVTDWQGGDGTWGSAEVGLVIRNFNPVGPGVYRSDGSFPVGGNWKALIRLHTGNSIEAVPVFLPRDPAIPAPGVPAKARFTRSFVPDKQILQREAIGGSPLLQNIAYALCGLIAVVWVASLGWGLRRLDRRLGVAPATATPAPADRALRRAG